MTLFNIGASFLGHRSEINLIFEVMKLTFHDHLCLKQVPILEVEFFSQEPGQECKHISPLFVENN